METSQIFSTIFSFFALQTFGKSHCKLSLTSTSLGVVVKHMSQLEKRRQHFAVPLPLPSPSFVRRFCVKWAAARSSLSLTHSFFDEMRWKPIDFLVCLVFFHRVPHCNCVQLRRRSPLIRPNLKWLFGALIKKSFLSTTKNAGVLYFHDHELVILRLLDFATLRF